MNSCKEPAVCTGCVKDPLQVAETSLDKTGTFYFYVLVQEPRTCVKILLYVVLTLGCRLMVLE